MVAPEWLPRVTQAVVAEEKIIAADDAPREGKNKKPHPVIEQTESNRNATGTIEDGGANNLLFVLGAIC